jgi:hypothetical protein
MILDILTVLFFVLGFVLVLWMIGERRRDVLHGPHVTKEVAMNLVGVPYRGDSSSSAERSNEQKRDEYDRKVRLEVSNVFQPSRVSQILEHLGGH